MAVIVSIVKPITNLSRMAKLEIRFHPAESFFLYEPGKRIKISQKKKVDSLLAHFEEKLVDLVGFNSGLAWRSRMMPDGTMTWLRSLAPLEKKQLLRIVDSAFKVNGLRDDYGCHVFLAKLQWTQVSKKRKRGEDGNRLVLQVEHLGWYCDDTGKFVSSCPVKL